MTGSGWTLPTNHGHVLVCLTRDPDARMRALAEAVGLTERAVQQVVHDLVEEGYVREQKVERRNRYEVVRARRLRHPLESQVDLGSFPAVVSRPTRESGSAAGIPR